MKPFSEIFHLRSSRPPPSDIWKIKSEVENRINYPVTLARDVIEVLAPFRDCKDVAVFDSIWSLGVEVAGVFTDNRPRYEAFHRAMKVKTGNQANVGLDMFMAGFTGVDFSTAYLYTQGKGAPSEVISLIY